MFRAIAFTAIIASASLAAIPAFAGYYDYSGHFVGDLAGGTSAMPGSTHRMTTGGYSYNGHFGSDLAGGRTAMPGTTYHPTGGYDYSGHFVGDLAGGTSTVIGTTYYQMPDGSWSTTPPATPTRHAAIDNQPPGTRGR